jgi:urea transport system substrate-binding protein
MDKTQSRRRFLKNGAAAGSVLALWGHASRVAAADSSPIKIGAIDDLTGEFALVGTPRAHAYQLAADQINAAGGVLGRQLQVIQYDGQSKVNQYPGLAQRLLLQDQVDVLFAGYTSSEREAARAVSTKNKKILWHNNQGEGGIMSKYAFFCAPIPTHQVLPGVKYMVEKFGPKIYVLAADYGFGHITAQWTRVAAKMYNGNIIAEEFIPLSNTQYASIISRIQNAKPDWVMQLLVGDNQDQFYPQAAAAGLKLPGLSPVIIQQGYEHKRFAPPLLANVYVPVDYLEEIDTPANKTFLEAFRKKYPDEPYVNQPAACGYAALYLMAKAWQTAGTTDTDAVIKALESGLSYDGPQGKVSLVPQVHESSLDMKMARVTETHSIEWVQDLGLIEPDRWLMDDLNIDLRKSDPETWYTPEKDPKLPI